MATDRIKQLIRCQLIIWINADSWDMGINLLLQNAYEGVACIFSIFLCAFFPVMISLWRMCNNPCLIN